MNFLGKRETDLSAAFMQNGYIIQPCENLSALDKIRNKTVDLAVNFLEVPHPEDAGKFLDEIASLVPVEKLNSFRLHIISGLIKQPWFRESYFSCARSLVEILVGNELAMQRNIGLSIQMPGDDSSLLPLHSDSWGSECSPFEVVLWIPLVDCYQTKSMFLLPPDADAKWREQVKNFAGKGTESLYRAIEPELEWLEVPYGKVVLFTPTVMHGNRVNREPTTRWSMNVRFKGLFTPYSDKRLGEYFGPIAVRAASKIGMKFTMPGGFNE
ncbi:MAG: phytanoyl-CoA dioxygenase family protein [Microcoleus sp. PH2017_10_PVI_O_A]|uniref:sporadic carbohydrate cluster 2OG-Fe(II) oxygenase n=1 Tax=unclassified Microcoleus TaxID=2642155 RepID=UPI001D9DAB8D|nr:MULTISPECIES: sporadic carbohydrate cluster 2OG-Fe(II) oxygenase [unclassified Microcoleus]TAE80566.1 MAG: hypothetical protein EAZ83_17950 [Oscillatoriales cyanobacterium]MCC3405789.1 phytanoyl-CoA dioxygenase family protein [Microcoleus sp. PH2017_10_PVI_O_A]MCC3459906.1 phytanoyl-CoA dioxygenase family protein [Microcoleus sp. PH2017_11_PCY_U_A]MCC3478294.1 phytanoyl-CoA dioxygenase family protein [Microcoleus sp. PH2017_12_PCY_D_A]MCC3559273.1 phytanoyl-CoA dioxygenase family protein [M